MEAARNPPRRVVALLPAWNATAFIEPVLESLAAQTYPNLQVLVSDDASTDGTGALCERFARGRPSFVVHRQAVNRGWIGNVNWLLGAARGDYYFFAFHDDPLEPTYVARLVDALEAAPQAVLAYTDVVLDMRSAEHFVSQRSYPDIDGIDSARERMRLLMPFKGDWWIPNRGLFRGSAAARVGGLRRHFGGEVSADWLWLVHLSLLGSFVRVPEPLVRKVWRQEGLSLSWRHSLRERLGVVFGAAREIARADVPLLLRLRVLADFWAYWSRRWGRRLWSIGRRKTADGRSANRP